MTHAPGSRAPCAVLAVQPEPAPARRLPPAQHVTGAVASFLPHCRHRDNVSKYNLADGLVVRDSTDGVVSHNDLHDNCSGLTFVNTNSSMPVAHWVVRDNTMSHNNLFCPLGDLDAPFSPVAGNGIAIAGGQDIVLRHNTVADNQGSTFLSGGSSWSPRPAKVGAMLPTTPSSRTRWRTTSRPT